MEDKNPTCKRHSISQSVRMQQKFRKFSFQSIGPLGRFSHFSPFIAIPVICSHFQAVTQQCLPFPVISSRLELFQPFPDISRHIRPFQQFPGISSHFQSYPTISRNIQLFPAISCHSANSSHFQPFPAIIPSSHNAII